MKDGLTDINIVLDRSGSMSSIKSDMEGGLANLIKEQKGVEGEATVSLYQFDTHFDEVFIARDIQSVDAIELVPRGGTALLDAMGRAIVTTGERLAAMKEEDRPSKVIFVIITDGYENSSKEYNRDRVKELIKHQEETYNWDFVFLGANQDAVQEAARYGISENKAMTYSFNTTGSYAMMSGLSCAMSSARMMRDAEMNFTSEMKAAANGDEH